MSGKRQFGTVRRLPSGRWQARYRDGSGQMFSAPSTFPTKTDAARFVAVVEADIARRLYIDPRGTSNLRRVVRPPAGVTREARRIDGRRSASARVAPP